MITAPPLFLPFAKSKPVSAPSDELLERLRQGEGLALATVYDEHHRTIRAFGQRLTGDHALAEDLVQEVFLALPKAVRNFRGDAPLRSFLLGIAANHARHYVRAAARRRASQERLAALPGNGEVEPAPDHQVERKRLAELLTKALDALPIKLRLAFVLCEVEERSSKEAGIILNIPEATVRTRVFHAKKKLRELLETEERV